MPRRKRTTPGLVTLVGDRLRIINGDVESLKKMRRPGRPKKTDVIVPSIPDYPTYDELQEYGDNGFHVVRSNQRKQQKKAEHQSLQARFDDLASPVVATERWDSVTKTVISPWGTEFSTARIEKSVPGSFCTCQSNKTNPDPSPCLIHGVKFDDCVCGGIDGTWGYRVCNGHRGRS